MPIQSFDDFSLIYEKPQIDGLIVGFSGIDPQKKREVVSLSPEQQENIKQLVLSEISTGTPTEGDCKCDHSNLSDEQIQIVSNIINNKIVNSYNEVNPGKALDATKGKELNERVAALEGISGFDYGEITVSENNGG